MQLQKSVSDLTESIDHIKDISKEQQSILESKIGELETRLRAVSNEKEDLTLQLQDAQHREKSARGKFVFSCLLSITEDLLLHVKQEQEATSNYERELLQHANTMKSISEIKEKLAHSESKVKSFETEISTLQHTLSTKENSWKEQEQIYKNQISELSSQFSTISDQNKSLLSQLDNFTDQLMQLQKQSRVVLIHIYFITY